MRRVKGVEDARGGGEEGGAAGVCQAMMVTAELLTTWGESRLLRKENFFLYLVKAEWRPQNQ